MGRSINYGEMLPPTGYIGNCMEPQLLQLERESRKMPTGSLVSPVQWRKVVTRKPSLDVD